MALLAVATSWTTPTMFEARCSSMVTLAALKIVTVLKITTFTPDLDN